MGIEKDYKIQMTRDFVTHRDFGVCQWPGCNKRGSQMAHILSRSLFNVARIKRLWDGITTKQAEFVLNHPLNLKLSCAEHNQYFLRDSGDEYVTGWLRDSKNMLEREYD